jgi:hypothetical protein
MPAITTLRRLRKEDIQFEASLGYIARPCITRKKENKTKSPFLTENHKV